MARAPDGTRMIPCPQQTKGGDVTCVECRLCLDADGLMARNMGIAFAAHGASVRKVRARLPVLQ